MSARRLWRWLAALLGAGLVAFAGHALWQLHSYGFLRLPSYEREPPPLPPLKKSWAVLVFSKTNAFIHREAIPAAEALFRSLGEEGGFDVYVTDNGASHTPEFLRHFAAVVWNNVTGNVLLPEQQRAFRAWLEGGGGFLGLHGAGDSSSDWDWYIDQVIGARFIGHPFDPQFQTATLRVAQPPDPIVDHLPAAWVRLDEWYSFAESPRRRGKQVLVTLDERTYRPVDHFGRDLRMGSDHPVIWKGCVGRGRVFYSALGHTAESYAEPEYAALLAKALRWAARRDGEGCDG
ncbi:MAG: Crp/Fnr family transcriptional regulator [Porticoccaceae bacterium]|nr:MAG: Crp/Fnr family transcriptional regulator [Porticoccaceae bacterium]